MTNLDQPSGLVEIRAPISGVITDQQVTNAAGVQGLSFAQSIYDLRSDLRLDSCAMSTKMISPMCASGKRPTFV